MTTPTQTPTSTANSKHKHSPEEEASGNNMAAALGIGVPTGSALVVWGTPMIAGYGPLIAGAGLTTGGTAILAVSAAVVAKEVDKNMYGAEDKRFSANLKKKPNMVGLGNGKFHDQLANPETGEVDFNDIGTLNKLEVLAHRETEKEKAAMKENWSWRPRSWRSDDGVAKQESARGDIHIAESALKETQTRIDEINRAESKINALANNAVAEISAERDAILDRALHPYENASQKEKDIARIGEMLGADNNPTAKIENEVLARSIIDHLQQTGSSEVAKQQALQVGESLKHAKLDDTMNDKLADASPRTPTSPQGRGPVARR